MSLSRHARHHVRAHYLQALKALPLPAPSVGPVDPARLTILGRDHIADRTVVFGTHADAPRLWTAIDTTGTDAADSDKNADNSGLVLLGYFTGLVSGEPDLWVCDDTHRIWAMEGDNTPELKRAAIRIWSDCTRDCEG